jgi:hypothetical protein
MPKNIGMKLQPIKNLESHDVITKKPFKRLFGGSERPGFDRVRRIFAAPKRHLVAKKQSLADNRSRIVLCRDEFQQRCRRAVLGARGLGKNPFEDKVLKWTKTETAA